MPEPHVGRQRILFTSFFTMFAFLFSMQAIPPLLPLIIAEYGLSFTSASSLMWLVAIPGLFLSILGGLLVAKSGVKFFLTTGMLIATIGSMLCAFSWSFPLMQFSRLLIGIGGSLIVVSAPAIIFQRFEKNELGSAMGLFSLNMPAATVISFNVLGVFASQYGWRFSIFCTVVVNISALIICIISKDGDRIKPKKIDLKPLRNVNIWILGLIWALFNMAAIGYTTWGKTIFVQYDWLPITLSDLVASLLMLGAFIAPLTGIVSDRLGKRKPLIIISCICMFGIFLIFPYIQKIFLIPLALMLGLLAAFLPPALFALPEELLGEGKGGIGLGVLNTFLNLGVIIGPLTIGYVLDFTDSGHLGFFVMGFFVLLASLLASILKAR